VSSLKGKTLFITGGSRGARIAIAAKTTEPHRYLPGTIYTAAQEIERLGGEALPLVADVRSEESIAAAVEQTVARFGGIDICVNNASAIKLESTQAVSMKSFDLMHQVNVRGTFLTSKLCIPHLLRAENAHVLTLSPPLDFQPKWFANHVAYSISKYAMSMVTLGMAKEFADAGIAFNALWPRTPIATAAIEFNVGASALARCRTPEIMADAAHCILTQPSRRFTGQFWLDDSVLHEVAGVTDFARYRVSNEERLKNSLFVEPTLPKPPGVAATIA
jgi:citronellol/citronellal dehydrogenase